MPGEAKEEVKEIRSQQVLLPDGCVFSEQSVYFLQGDADVLTAPILQERYLRVIRKWTLSLIRPVQGGDGVKFTFLGIRAVSLLTFAPPERVQTADRDEVRLRIVGGLLVQRKECGRGVFSFSLERGADGVLAAVKLADFCPLLLGTRKPSLWRKFLYKFSQAYIHKLVTVGYLSWLYRTITGRRVRFTVTKVTAGEGTEI